MDKSKINEIICHNINAIESNEKATKALIISHLSDITSSRGKRHYEPLIGCDRRFKPINGTMEVEVRNLWHSGDEIFVQGLYVEDGRFYARRLEQHDYRDLVKIYDMFI